MWHFDVRIICAETGKLEATEDSFYANQQDAWHTCAKLSEYGNARYTVVPCDAEGGDIVHDVDVSFYNHSRIHMGDVDTTFVRYVGAPSQLFTVPFVAFALG